MMTSSRMKSAIFFMPASKKLWTSSGRQIVLPSGIRSSMQQIYLPILLTTCLGNCIEIQLFKKYGVSERRGMNLQAIMTTKMMMMKIERFDEKMRKKRHQRMLLLHTLAASTLFWGFQLYVGELPLLGDFFENGFKDDDSFEVPTIATAPKGMDIATRKFLRTRFLKRKNKKESQTCLKGHCNTAAPIWNFENKAVTRSIPSTPTCYAGFEQRIVTNEQTDGRTAMTMITSRMRKQAVSVPPPLPPPLHLLAWNTASSPIQHV